MSSKYLLFYEDDVEETTDNLKEAIGWLLQRAYITPPEGLKARLLAFKTTQTQNGKPVYDVLKTRDGTPVNCATVHNDVESIVSSIKEFLATKGINEV